MSRRDYPTGIPIRPPLGWLPPRAGQPRSLSPFVPVVWAGLISLMLFTCTVVGILVVQPRQTGMKPESVDSLRQIKPSPATAPQALSTAPAIPHTRRADLTYEQHILPVMNRVCVSCHNNKKKKGNLDLRTLTALKRGGDAGPGVVEGKPDESPLWESIVTGRMPPGKPNAVSATEKDAIRQWILAGAER